MDAYKQEPMLTCFTACSMRWSLFSLRAQNPLSVFRGSAQPQASESEAAQWEASASEVDFVLYLPMGSWHVSP